MLGWFLVCIYHLCESYEEDGVHKEPDHHALGPASRGSYDTRMRQHQKPPISWLTVICAFFLRDFGQCKSHIASATCHYLEPCPYYFRACPHILVRQPLYLWTGLWQSRVDRLTGRGSSAIIFARNGRAGNGKRGPDSTIIIFHFRGLINWRMDLRLG